MRLYESLGDWLFYLPWGGESLLRTRAVEFAGLEPREDVLDICCGSGKLLPYIFRHVVPGGHVTGVDINKSVLELATHDTLGKPVNLLMAIAGSLPFPDSSFSGCFISMGLHHMSKEQRLVALQEVRRVLITGGRLVIADYNLPEKALPKMISRALIKLDKSKEAYSMLVNGSLLEEVEMAGLVFDMQEVICRGLIRLVKVTRTDEQYIN